MRRGGGGRCAGLAGSVPLRQAAVEEASDWHTGDSENASLRGPGGDQAATGAPALQKAVITSRLKNKSSVVF